MIGISAARLFRGGSFLFDFLIPAEVFFVILVGAGLLAWAAFRARRYQKLIPVLFGLAVFFLIAGLVVAQVSGLASGETAPQGVWWLALVSLLALYDLAAFGVFIAGILLSRDLFRRQVQPAVV